MGSGAYEGNDYPMKTTRLYYSPDGISGPDGDSDWEYIGVVASEEDIYVSEGGWVPDDAHHQGAPAATWKAGFYYLYVRNVSDITTGGSQTIYNSGKIGVWRSEGAFGPYDYQGVVTFPNGVDGGHMDNPDVFRNGSTQYLTWDDPSSCLGFKLATLNSTMRSVTNVKAVQVNGGPGCISGASLYRFNEASMPGPYTACTPATPNTTKNRAGTATSAQHPM